MRRAWVGLELGLLLLAPFAVAAQQGPVLRERTPNRIVVPMPRDLTVVPMPPSDDSVTATPLPPPDQDAAPADQMGPDQTGADQTGPNQMGPDQTGPDQTGANQTGADQTGADQTGPNQTGPDQTGANQPAADQQMVPNPLDHTSGAPAVASGSPARQQGQPWRGGWVRMGTATLQALDKVNARAETLVVKVGDASHFGSLNIAVRGCFIRSPDQPADATAFLVIRDQRPDAPSFVGWMDRDAPSMSMLAHPLYDVRIEGCSP